MSDDGTVVLPAEAPIRATMFEHLERLYYSKFWISQSGRFLKDMEGILRDVEADPAVSPRTKKKVRGRLKYYLENADNFDEYNRLVYLLIEASKK